MVQDHVLNHQNRNAMDGKNNTLGTKLYRRVLVSPKRDHYALTRPIKAPKHTPICRN